MAAVPSSVLKPSASSSALAPDTSADFRRDLLKQIRSNEIAIAELNALPSSKGVYQRKGNIFFRTSTQKVTASEQKQLDIAKAKLQQL